MVRSVTDFTKIILKNDLVLEVGSGNAPSPRSDVLCDKFFDDGYHRHGKKIVNDRPLVIGDILKLPFRDKIFDFVIASHVLEHVENPGQATSELSRVGRRGYIECPSELSERLFGWKFHRWYVNNLDSKIIFTPKTETDCQFGQLFHTMFEKDILFYQFHASYPNLFYIQHFWEHKIDVEILTHYQQIVSFEDQEQLISIIRNTGKKYYTLKERLIRAGKALAPQFIRKRKKISSPDISRKLNLNDFICCPVCHGDLSVEKQRIICCSCSRRYPVENGIFYLDHELAEL